nr:adenosylhomocysteinase [Candidatus Freyarchaeota archaeon]
MGLWTYLVLRWIASKFCDSMSFSDQSLAVEYIAKNRDSLSKMGSVVLDIPEEIDKTVAELKCKAMNLKLDVLTPEQEAYLSGWAEGTT